MNRTARLLAISITALALTSACATTKTDTPGTAASKAAVSGSATAPELRLGYFANVTHASAVYGVGEGIYADKLGSTKAQDAGLQRRPGRGRGAVRRRPRRGVPRPQPGDQRVREEQGRGHPHHRGRDLRRRLSRRTARHHDPRAAEGQEDRVAADRRHAGHRAAHLPGQERPQDRPARCRRHDDHRRGQQPDPAAVQGRQDRRRLGARAVGLAAGASRAAARSSSTRRRCGRRASSSPPT